MQKTPILLTVLSLAIAGSSHAALVFGTSGGVSLVSTSTIDSPAGLQAASDGNTSSVNNGQIYTNARNGGTGDYFSTTGAQGGAPFVIDINLGNAFSVDAVAFWNRNNTQSNSVRLFNVTFSTDSTFGNGDDSSVFNFTAANSGGGQQDFALGSVVNNAQYVRVSITDNYFGISGAGGDRIGFTEFQFNAVPEPSSTALLGLAGLGLILRRRR